MILLKSIVVGMFSILPGVSGSTLAISLNLYDRFFKSIHDIKNNKLFLIELLIGILIGLFIGSKIIIYIIGINIIYYILIGIILSEIPVLINKCKILYIPLIISFLFSSLTNIITSNILINLNINFRMFLGGLLFSFGKIIPGISSSCFLLSLGIYKDIMIIFSKPSLLLNTYYIPFIIGFLIGIIIFIKILSYMINNRYNLFYSMIIGFVSSSIFLIIPKSISIIGIILMIITFIISICIKLKK